LFYKESAELDEHYLNNPNDMIEWHGEDLIYSFTWFNGKMTDYINHRNGFPINVPDSKEIK
jgi:hypothetical protein